MAEELKDMVGTLLDQLTESQKQMKPIISNNPAPLTRAELDDFVIKSAGELVRNSLDLVKNAKEYVQTAPGGEEVESLASLVNATANAIDTLSKISIADKKNETTLKAKEMDVKSRREIVETSAALRGPMLTREEVLERLISGAKNVTEIETL